MVEETISQEIYYERSNKYKEKVEKISNKIDRLKSADKNDNGIEDGIKKLKQMIEQDTIMEEFDSDVFDALVDYVIIGGYSESGQIDPYMIRFICKSRFQLSAKDEVTKQKVMENSYIENTKFSIILDFINRQNIFVFEKDERGNIRKNILDKIRVRVEME